MSAEPDVVEAGSRFPFINLSRAIERARVLHREAGQHSVLVTDLPRLWGYTEKASGWRQTVAALKYYGLISDAGSKDRRQVRLTEDARRYFLDERPEVHAELNKKFALLPKGLAALWGLWKSFPPADPIARSRLKVEFGYAENAAAELLGIYKANLSFANLTDRNDDSHVGEQASPPRMRLTPTPPPPPVVKVGDYVQWTSDGQDQFDRPKRINWVSEDGGHARVFGSMTGIPIDELTVTDPPKVPPSVRGLSGSDAYAGGDGDLNVLLHGNRLEITADVDRAGLKRLKEILSKYEEILNIIDPPASQ